MWLFHCFNVSAAFNPLIDTSLASSQLDCLQMTPRRRGARQQWTADVSIGRLRRRRPLTSTPSSLRSSLSPRCTCPGIVSLRFPHRWVIKEKLLMKDDTNMIRILDFNFCLFYYKKNKSRKEFFIRCVWTIEPYRRIVGSFSSSIFEFK